MGYLLHCTYKVSVGQQRAMTTIASRAALRVPQLLHIEVQLSVITLIVSICMVLGMNVCDG